MAEALARGLCVDHDVEVWTTALGPPVAPDDRTGAFPVRRLPAIEIAHTPVAPRLLRLLLALPADSVVHVHVAQALWPELVALSAARRDFRVVAHFHLDVDPSGRGGFLLPLYKRHLLARVLQHADAVLALTRAQADFLATQYGVESARLHLLPNGVDDAFHSVPRSTVAPGRPVRALFVGRLDGQKNIPRLLRAVALVDEPVELVVVGDGEERARCEALRDELRLSHVQFVGAQYGAALVTWYEWADLFVLASDREGMPLALLEAMAAGLAVVATDVSELSEQVGGAGLVVAPDEPHLAGAITSLARDRTLLTQLQDRARARGRSLGWDSVVARLSSLYEDLPT